MKEHGFTLIELMIVMAVIAILVGIILPSFRGIQDEGNVSRASVDVRTLQTAVESYYIHNSNVLPTALSNLTSATPRIVNSIPDDPFGSSGADYSFSKCDNDLYYVVFSIGPDRTADITGIGTGGAVVGSTDDDVYATNGNF